MTEQAALSIIIVNYNADPHLIRCMQSLYEPKSEISFEVIVVDNGSRDGGITRIRHMFQDAIVVSNQQNIGFAAACNQGIARARGKNILLLNPDTIVSSRALEDTLNFLNSMPEAGIIGCRILDSKGDRQSSHWTFPTSWDYLFDSLFLTKLFPRSRLFGRLHLTYTEFRDPAEVDMVQGSFLMCKRQVIDQIGLLDERFFMYAEERDFCYRAKAVGWKVIYYPGAEIIHLSGASTAQNAVEMFIEQKKSTLKFHLKHDSARQVAMIRVYLFLGVLIRLLIWNMLSVVRGSTRDIMNQRVYSAATRWFLQHAPIREARMRR